MSISSIKEMAIGLNYNHFKNEQNWNISDYNYFRKGKDGKLHNNARRAKHNKPTNQPAAIRGDIENR